ncbi:MAG: hypothetical protein JO187_02850 [Acidobacteria bacterium]|nr:hypothetical protein [Acidobacteriota bacterium]
MDQAYASFNDACKTVLGAEAYAYHQEYVSKTPDRYQPETLRRLRGAGQITAAAYISSRRELDASRRSVLRTFDSVDLLVTPTTPVPPFLISDLLTDPSTMRTREVLMLRNTRPFNGWGLPTISIPCGFTKAGLPIGMQITGRTVGEATVVRLAHAYEQATEWHKRVPASV